MPAEMAEERFGVRSVHSRCSVCFLLLYVPFVATWSRASASIGRRWCVLARRLVLLQLMWQELLLGASSGQEISANKAVFPSLSFSTLLRRGVGWWCCALRGWLPWRKLVADSSVPAQFNKCHICLLQFCGAAAWSFLLSCRGGEGMEWLVAADGGAGEGREDDTASGRRRISVAQVRPSTEEAGGQLLRDLTMLRQVIFNLHRRPLGGIASAFTPILHQVVSSPMLVWGAVVRGHEFSGDDGSGEGLNCVSFSVSEVCSKKNPGSNCNCKFSEDPSCNLYRRSDI